MGKWRHLWWLWAILVGTAQIYVGLHYPLDILGGAVLGITIGLSMGTIAKHYMGQLRKENIAVGEL